VTDDHTPHERKRSSACGLDASMIRRCGDLSMPTIGIAAGPHGTGRWHGIRQRASVGTPRLAASGCSSL
jgi:hypothetical protein